jgi:hypothetical protein
MINGFVSIGYAGELSKWRRYVQISSQPLIQSCQNLPAHFVICRMPEGEVLTGSIKLDKKGKVFI